MVERRESDAALDLRAAGCRGRTLATSADVRSTRSCEEALRRLGSFHEALPPLLHGPTLAIRRFGVGEEGAASPEGLSVDDALGAVDLGEDGEAGDGTLLPSGKASGREEVPDAIADDEVVLEAHEEP